MGTIFDPDVKKDYEKINDEEKIDIINNKIDRHISNSSFSSFDNNQTFHLYESGLTENNLRASHVKKNKELSRDTQFVNITLNKRVESTDNISFKQFIGSGINVKVTKNDNKDEDGKYIYYLDEEIGKGEGTAEVSEALRHEEDIKKYKIPFYYYVMKRKIEKEDI
jgi:hypothetical protein